jgi:GNAT superfamily N-acetyltransferase
MPEKIKVTTYKATDHPEVLRLLLELHSTYFSQIAPPQIQELQVEKDIKKAYEKYLYYVTHHKPSWQILVAKTAENKTIGFIIGSVETDNTLEISKIGKCEDWYVEPEYRGFGIGMKLFNEMEKWLIKKGCKRVHSETWQGNELSINAHVRAGFFISGVTFSKKL